jgi:hypothetical protein
LPAWFRIRIRNLNADPKHWLKLKTKRLNILCHDKNRILKHLS